MKNLIRLYAFWYGCLGTCYAFAWYVLAIQGRATITNNVWIVEGVFALHAMAALATFQRTSMLPTWRPVLDVTPRRVVLAKVIFGLSIVNFLVCLAVFLIAELRGNVALGDDGVALILTSFLMLNTIYIAIHWAFRPENLFSASFLRVIANPLGEVFSSSKKP